LLLKIIKAIPVFVLAVVLTVVFGRTGLLRQLETSAFDFLLQIRNVSERTNDIVVVQITDADYRGLFNGKSPLDPATLKTVLTAIANGGPRVIGVDIDTSPDKFQQLRVEPGWPPVVWARTAVYSRKTESFLIDDVLGGQNADVPSGLVMLQQDADGAVRRYSRSYLTSSGDFPSLASELAMKFDPKSVSNVGQPGEDYFIQYSGYKRDSPFVHVDASKVVQWANEGQIADNPLLKDKLVLLGGAFGASDEHDTPFGWMVGVDILAHATRTELTGGGPRPARGLSLILLQIFDGFVLVLLFQLFGLKRAVVFSLAAIPVLSILCSLVAFGSLAFWAYFAPVGVAVLLQQLYDRAKEGQKNLVKDISRRLNELSPDNNGEKAVKITDDSQKVRTAVASGKKRRR
jgi:CHASE2 domain-containing sensor protein